MKAGNGCFEKNTYKLTNGKSATYIMQSTKPRSVIYFSSLPESLKHVASS